MKYKPIIWLFMTGRMKGKGDHRHTSYNEEMKKHTIRGKLFAVIGKNLNNRLAVFKW